MIKNLETVDYKKLFNQYYILEKNIEWLSSDRGKQAGVQYRKYEYPFLSATGKLKNNINEHEYNILNPLFKNTIFEEVINKFNLFRSRLMWMYEKTCYSLHKDTTKRIHIPIITNDQCYFLFPNAKLIHLEEGHIYEVDTRNMHSFCNFSNTPRLHFIGCLND